MYRLLFVLFLLGTMDLSAQSVLVSASPSTASATTVATTTDEVVEDWPIFLDTENRVYFIDFASFTVNFERIIVRNALDNVVLEDLVSDLPVDTIYEIDFAELPDGQYSIELESVAGLYLKEVTIE